MSNTSLRYSISAYVGLIMNILAPVIVVPIICFRFGNWLLLFGSLFIWLGEAVGSHKTTKYVFFIAVVIGSGICWASHSFNIHTELTFYIICFLFGFLCYQLYRAIGFGDSLSKAMIAAQGNRYAGEEINEDIEMDLDKMVWGVVKKYSDRRDFDFSDAVKSASSELGISESEILANISKPEGATEIIQQLKQVMEERKRANQEALDWIKSAKSD